MEPIKFIHVADTHLGYKQYKNEERFRDYNRAFKWILEKALAESVDFIVLSGDFFNDNRINPETLTSVFKILEKFKETALKTLNREIPLICIEGNHDKRGYYSLRSWMQFLADQGLIILLDISEDQIKDEKKIEFKPYSREHNRGGMFQIKDARIYGIPFMGSVTPSIFPLVLEALPQGDDTYNILMMHFGIEGQVAGERGVKIDDDLSKIHEKIDYLALGHFHKQYKLPDQGTWIYNPGSIEYTNLKEFYYKDEKGDNLDKIRGAFLVTVTGKEPHQTLVDSIQNIPAREVRSHGIGLVPEIPSFNEAKEFIIEKLKKIGLKFREKSRDVDLKDQSVPVLSLLLDGEISFSNLEFNHSDLYKEIMENFELLDVRIHSNFNSTIDGISYESGDDLPINLIEKEVFSSIINESEDYKQLGDEIIDLIGDLKDLFINSRASGAELRDKIKMWWLATHKEDHARFARSKPKHREKSPSKPVQKTLFDKVDIEKPSHDEQIPLDDDEFDDGMD